MHFSAFPNVVASVRCAKGPQRHQVSRGPKAFALPFLMSVTPLNVDSSNADNRGMRLK